MSEVLGDIRCQGRVEWGMEAEGRGSYFLQAAYFTDGEAEVQKGE